MLRFITSHFRLRRRLKRALHVLTVRTLDCAVYKHALDSAEADLLELKIENEGLKSQRIHADRLHGELLNLFEHCRRHDLLRDGFDRQIRQKVEELWKARGDA